MASGSPLPGLITRRTSSVTCESQRHPDKSADDTRENGWPASSRVCSLVSIAPHHCWDPPILLSGVVLFKFHQIHGSRLFCTCPSPSLGHFRCSSMRCSAFCFPSHSLYSG
eukprot:1050214-Amphidinium_carterae.1